MEKRIHPVILAGGSGTRLWPLSRRLHPKQFLPLLSDRTMLQETVLRLGEMGEVGAPAVLCNEEHRFLAAEQLRKAGIEPRALLLEPVARGTAPAVALAALAADDPRELLLVLAADHLIRDTGAFHRAVRLAAEAAAEGNLVTFGIVPKSPETGYGYIRRGAAIHLPGGSVFRVDAFVEKPGRGAAERYLAEGGHYWNGGMFLFQAGRYLEELERHQPAMFAACRQALAGSRRDLDFVRVDPDAFAAAPADSIDYAVMEQTDRAVVVPLDAGWSDVGSWSSLWEAVDKDADGNSLQGDVLAHDSSSCYLHAERKLVAAVGLRDTVVVETDDAVLVAPRERVHEVGAIVERLREAGRSESEIHRRVYRPWGHYDCIDRGERFQVKRLVVKPGQGASLQIHHHRAEHWVVVRGTAKVQRGEEAFMLSENESTYIPIGVAHSLENPGVIPLEMVEVQSGSYLGEDDIVRLDDRYGRKGPGNGERER